MTGTPGDQAMGSYCRGRGITTIIFITSSAIKTSLFVVVFVFNVPPIAKVIWRRGHSFKSHPTDW